MGHLKNNSSGDFLYLKMLQEVSGYRTKMLVLIPKIPPSYPFIGRSQISGFIHSQFQIKTLVSQSMY